MEQRTGSMGRNNGGMGTSSREIGSREGAQLDELRARFGDLSERATTFIRERPGTAVLIAIGAGFLIGRMLRS